MTGMFTPLVVLLGLVAAANGLDTDASIAQVRDTLQNLITDIDNAGQYANSLFTKRQRWCDGTRYGFNAEVKDAKKSLVGLRAELAEQSAALQKVAGDVQQADVAIKRPNHKSLRSNLEAVLPALANDEVRVAETKHLITDRSESIVAIKAFVAALKDDCVKAARRGVKQAAGRTAKMNAVQAALQPLDDDVGTPVPPEMDVNTPHTMKEEEASMEEEIETEDDWDKTAPDPPASFLQWREAEVSVGSSREAVPQKQIGKLLVELKKNQPGVAKSPAWCADAQQRAADSLRLAKTSVTQVVSEVEAHQTAEAQLTEQLGKVQTMVNGLSDAVEEAANRTAQENALYAKSTKDTKISMKILAEATKITVGRSAADGLSDVAMKMRAAKSVFATQSGSTVDLEREAAGAFRLVRATAHEAAQALNREQADIELARSEHMSQRERITVDEVAHQADVNEAELYLKTLKEECTPQVFVQEEREREVQIRALEDEQRFLSGADVDASETSPSKDAPSNTGVRDGGAPATQDSSLSPLERAAARMGVADEA